MSSIWSHAEVCPFGSFATGLYLPSSDIDVVVLNSGLQNITARLETLAEALVRMNVASEVRVVAHARVPIVKFTDRISCISVDVSFDSITGVQAVHFMQDELRYFPSLEPVYLVLKMFLKHKELNEVYRTGGLNSFTLFVMLLMHLQTNGGRRRGSPVYSHWDELSNVGLVLIDFFDFYGRRLNVREDGISCRDGGYIFKKAAWGFLNARRPNLLAIEHPQIPGVDIGKNSFNFENIRLAFRQAHGLLSRVYHYRDPVLSQLIPVVLEAVEDTLASQKRTEAEI